ncbi:transcription factor RelB-like [Heptranchias perlo]|uniref:transcription factor RelB-like n=1 Tax=Heptranchias perlo TaxID=212740 RepID=UPI00355966AF
MKGRDQEQLSGPHSPTGASGSIQPDQNFDLNILSEFILRELEEGGNNSVQPYDFTDPQIGEIRNQLMDQIPGWAMAPAELMQMGTGSPQLVNMGTGSPQLVNRGTGSQLVNRGTGSQLLGTGSPQLVSRGTGSPQLVSRGTGSPQLVSRGTGSPQLVSRGTGSPQLVGKGNNSSDTKRKATSAARMGRSTNLSRSIPNVLTKGEEPRLVITEQPKQRGMRFRYECEGRSAGSIPGEHTTEHNKTLPTIQIRNWQGEVKVIVSLVTKDEPYKPHPHSLVGKDCQNGICEVTVSPKCNMKVSFANLGIQCMKKKEIVKALELRLKLGIDPFNVGDSARCPDDVDMNVVRLCFQAFIQEPHVTLSPVLSEPIYDKKATNTSELRICRLNKDCGLCTGGQELFLLCDKVQKEDIAVVFSKDNWEAKGVFSQTDVHRQIAIVFKIPPYCDIDIQEPVMVQLRLYRPSDKEYSDSFEFRYLPKINDVYGIRSKWKRKIKFPPINTFMDSNFTLPDSVVQLMQKIENRGSSFTSRDTVDRQTIGNQEFQFLANVEGAAQNFAAEEEAECYLFNQPTQNWKYNNQGYDAAAAACSDVALGEIQDELYNTCYMKDEPPDPIGYKFCSQPEELQNCREAEAFVSSFDGNYNILATVNDLSLSPPDDHNLAISDCTQGLEFWNGGGKLSSVLGRSIAMPNDQEGTEG